MRRALIGFTLLAAATAVSLPSRATDPRAPYAGLDARAVKALSSTELEELAAGKGMGMALAAELNGYPGPRHVLDLAGRLRLSPAQIAGTRRLFAEMQSAAQAIGQRVIAAEAALDKAFANRAIDRTALERMTGEIGVLRARLRSLHLGYHLDMKALLKPDQVAAYNALRGYGGSPAKPSAGHSGHH